MQVRDGSLKANAIAPGERASIPWQRQLPPHHLTFRQLKEKLDARTHGSDEPLHYIYAITAPWLSKREKEDLFFYHRVLTAQLFGEWARAIQEINPKLQIGLVERKFLFDSTQKTKFDRFVNWLMGKQSGDIEKIVDGDILEFPASNGAKFTFERKGDVVNVYRGVFSFEFKGELAQHTPSLLYTCAVSDEYLDLLPRITETEDVVKPATEKRKLIFGTINHRNNSTIGELRVRAENELKRLVKFEQLKEDMVGFLGEEEKIISGMKSIQEVRERFGPQITDLSQEQAINLWAFLHLKILSDFAKYRDKFIMLNVKSKLEEMIETKGEKLIVRFEADIKLDNANLEETKRITAPIMDELRHSIPLLSNIGIIHKNALEKAKIGREGDVHNINGSIQKIITAIWMFENQHSGNRPS